jgi:bacillithiol biosynthesis cysteine-adding enzyme BshC
VAGREDGGGEPNQDPSDVKSGDFEALSLITIPMSRLPHLPRLVADYFGAFDRVAEFFSGDFRDPAAFRLQTEKVQARDIPRNALAAILSEQNRGYGCGSRTLENIDKIVRDRACAVVTGQQVGLFSGPLYTVYKALTAVKLADRLNQPGSGCFVPIFWLASDDHDLAEIDHLVLLDQENRLQEIRCPTPSGESKIPASKILLPPEIEDCLRRAGGLTRDSEFKAAVLAGLGDAYRPGRSWAEAFARWLTGLFESRGLIFIDPGDPRLKELGRDVFCREIAEKSAATRPALAVTEKLRRAGYGEQVHLHEGILNVFFAERERRTIQWSGDSFEIKDPARKISPAELLELARKNPGSFSPNVLLRPIYQDAVLPTVAYIGGPGEIAYFAQLKGVYEKFGLPMPVIYPRKSATILESKIGRVLEKFGLDVPDFWRDPEGLIADLGKDQIPEALSRALGAARADTDLDFASLAGEIAAFEPTLRESVRLAQGKVNQQWTFLEKKIGQAATKRSEIAARQLRAAADHLYPNRNLQERVFGVVPYLIKYGLSFLDRIDAAIDLDEYGHQVVSPE